MRGEQKRGIYHPTDGTRVTRPKELNRATRHADHFFYKLPLCNIRPRAALWKNLWITLPPRCYGEIGLTKVGLPHLTPRPSSLIPGGRGLFPAAQASGCAG
jgi:hypothetical protein